MNILRTPESRFENLDGYPFAPHYAEVGGLRMHYVDEGAGDPILCLHGEPSWSYLYRKMIPILVAAGHRVIAPDLIGFGKSDKPADRADYTYAMHFASIEGFVRALDLRRVTLVCQDWGGLIGLPVAAVNEERFARLVIMNTGLPTGERPPTAGFMAWRSAAEKMTDMDVGRVLQSACVTKLTPEIIAAYNAPYPDQSYKAGAHEFPMLVPISPESPAAPYMRRAREVFNQWTKPALVMFSDKDPVTKGGEKSFLKMIPTAKDEPEITIHDAGHFLQEDKGEEIAGHIVEFIARRLIPGERVTNMASSLKQFILGPVREWRGRDRELISISAAEFGGWLKTPSGLAVLLLMLAYAARVLAPARVDVPDFFVDEEGEETLAGLLLPIFTGSFVFLVSVYLMRRSYNGSARRLWLAERVEYARVPWEFLVPVWLFLASCMLLLFAPAGLAFAVKTGDYLGLRHTVRAAGVGILVMGCVTLRALPGVLQGSATLAYFRFIWAEIIVFTAALLVGGIGFMFATLAAILFELCWGENAWVDEVTYVPGFLFGACFGSYLVAAFRLRKLRDPALRDSFFGVAPAITAEHGRDFEAESEARDLDPA